MVDIHTHILPGVDDGSDCFTESVQMVEMAYETGVDRIIVTPHCNQRGRYENYWSGELEQLFYQLKNRIKEEGIPVELFLGMEIMASQDLISLIEKQQVVSLNASRYYLIEFLFDTEIGWMNRMLQSVLEIGKIPVVAHPERYFEVQKSPDIVQEWKRRGIIIQLNKGSVFGAFGRRCKKAAKYLMENDWIHCIASDAHSPYMRTTSMEELQDYLLDRYSYQKMEEWTTKNPNAIIENKLIEGL